MLRLDWAKMMVALREKRVRVVVMLGVTVGSGPFGRHFLLVVGSVPLRQTKRPAMSAPGEGEAATQRRRAIRTEGLPKSWHSVSLNKRWVWLGGVLMGVYSNWTVGMPSILMKGVDSYPGGIHGSIRRAPPDRR